MDSSGQISYLIIIKVELMSSETRPMIFAPNGQLGNWCKTDKLQIPNDVSNQMEITRRRQCASYYWENQDQDGIHYSFQEYEAYLNTGDWSEMLRMRQKLIDDENQLIFKQQEQWHHEWLERQLDRKLMEMLLDPYHLEDQDDWSEIGEDEEYWESDNVEEDEVD